MSKIGIDIDNTICNTSEFYGQLALKYDRDILHKNSVINFNKFIPKSEEWSKEELDYYLENIINKESINIPIKEDAKSCINRLKEQGYEIVFITNRGCKDDDHTDLIVSEYLDKNGIPYDNIITKANDKYLYLDNCEYFIDDAPHNCEDALENIDVKVIMVETNKTKDYNNDRIFKTNSWEEIYNYITK
ncbi:MAG: hypothetical protein IKP98_00645 [Bacilli bacterium]|nr:hypothetical protein [Bacilli bacterium]